MYLDPRIIVKVEESVVLKSYGIDAHCVPPCQDGGHGLVDFYWELGIDVSFLLWQKKNKQI